jgi:hypothetical protein
MTRKLTLKAALASTAALFALAPAASAQQGYYGGYDELYLFDHERYYGQSVVLDGPVAAIYDFNDRAESVDFLRIRMVALQRRKFRRSVPGHARTD